MHAASVNRSFRRVRVDTFCAAFRLRYGFARGGIPRMRGACIGRFVRFHYLGKEALACFGRCI